MVKYLKSIMVPVLCMGVGIFLGYFLNTIIKIDPELRSEYRNSTKQLAFINPLLECESSEDLTELSPFKEDIQELTDNYISEGRITEASVYFRDMNNGPWVSLNENKKFAPASLFKVPLAMYFLKKSEKEPDILLENIKIKKEDVENFPQYYSPKESMNYGEVYSVRDLLEHMIKYSDNTAKTVLFMKSNNQWVGVFEDLGVTLPEDLSNEDFLSVKDYARFFRVLYNASYLNRENSNYLLKLLSETSFTSGINRGTPQNVIVSHKFGERTMGELKQLHDCGIVYYEKSPYLLCVMSRGYDFTELSNYIGDVANLVYKKVSQR